MAKRQKIDITKDSAASSMRTGGPMKSKKVSSKSTTRSSMSRPSHGPSSPRVIVKDSGVSRGGGGR